MPPPTWRFARGRAHAAGPLDILTAATKYPVVEHVQGHVAETGARVPHPLRDANLAAQFYQHCYRIRNGATHAAFVTTAGGQQ